MVVLPLSPWSPEYLREQQLNDPELAPVLIALDKESPPDLLQIVGKSANTKYLVRQWDSLELKDGVMHRRWINARGPSTLQLVLPTSLVPIILECAHNPVPNAHFRVNKMLKKIRERFYWPDYTQDVRNFCNTCLRCRRRGRRPATQAPMSLYNVGVPWERVGVDI